MKKDLKRKTNLANYFASQPEEVRDAFILGQIYYQACCAHDTPFNAPQEDLKHLEWLEQYEKKTGLRIINP